MAFRKNIPVYTISVKGIPIEVHTKPIKNTYLRMNRNSGKLKLSVPWQLSRQQIEGFVISHIPWIEKHLQVFEKQQQIPQPEYISGEHHFLWGQECELSVVPSKTANVLKSSDGKLELYAKPGATAAKRADILKAFYRGELKREIPLLIQKWEKPMGVQVREFGVKRMKTRWGTCNIRDKRIWLNLELAKKEPACLEYVVVHEMVHLLERLHNKRFYAFMDFYLPGWRRVKQRLNGRVD